MSGPIIIEELKLSGFRAYLHQKIFKLAEKNQAKSLAIFAPNAKGKSSLVDSLEFFFSEHGTLSRLGRRRSSIHAGPDALAHVKAKEKGIEPSVSLKFKSPDGPFEGNRSINNFSDAIPDAAERIRNTQKLDFIIRGSQLRYFVEQESPSQRYSEVSEWFGLTALLSIQDNLRSLRLRIKQSLDEDSATKERLDDLKRETDYSINVWVEESVVGWVNENYIKPLASDISLHKLEQTDPSYETVRQYKVREENETGLAQLKQSLRELKKVFTKEKKNQTEPGSYSSVGIISPDAEDAEDEKTEIGLIPEIEVAFAKLKSSQQLEKNERQKCANNIFKDIWEAAQQLLSNQDQIFDNCPVCDTPFEATSKGSRAAVTIYIEQQLDSLKSYRKAHQELISARKTLNDKVSLAKTGISNLLTALEVSGNDTQRSNIKHYYDQLNEWRFGQDLPSTTEIKDIIFNLHSTIEEEKKKKEEQQGEATWIKTFEKINALIVIKERLQSIKLVRAELEKLQDNLSIQEMFIASEIRKYCQKVINKLRNRVNEIFRAVHPEEEKVPEIRLELDEESKISELKLLFDFSPNRKNVVPSGYLSDSQIHTLALSLRLAAIEMFNKNIPIIILDDVVTSYDADHRRAIAGLFANQFIEHQILIMTHDERFFHYLIDQLPSSKWIFQRITSLDPLSGPKFSSHNLPDKKIEELHSQDESAANEMRQSEEDWLIQICRDFGVDVRIRELNKAYSYNRSELAEALMRFLKSKKLTPPLVKGVANNFLITLSSGQIENFGSHFQDNPLAFGSIGDEKTRWREFKSFRDNFRCPSCKSQRFKRPDGMEKPVCKKCETTFAFSDRPPQTT